MINADDDVNDGSTYGLQHEVEMSYYRALIDFYTLHSNVIKSEQCKIDCEIYKNAFINRQMWALKMFDSSSKMQSGFLSGNLADFGDFTQCINLEENFGNGTIIRGKYVLIKLIGYIYMSPFPFQAQQGFPFYQLPYLSYLNDTFPDPAKYRLPMFTASPTRRILPTHRWAICLPDSCNLEETVEHLRLYMNRDNVTYISEALEQTLDSQWTIRDCDWIVIGIFVAIGVLMVVQTVYDTYLHYSKTKTKHWTLIAFSVLTNGRHLFKTSNRPELLPCLDGIRVICMLWILLGHDSESLMFGFNYNTFAAFQIVRQFWFQFISCNQTHLDVFLMFGGFLIMYGFLRSRERQPTFNILLFYIRRYLRLTPSLVAAILFHISLGRLLGDGPMFQKSMPRFEQICKDNWWQSLLYISNYVDPTDICVPQTWYLSVDTQLYWLSPLLLLPVVWWKKCAYFLFGIILVISTGVVWFIVYDNKLIASGATSDYLIKYHTATHCRITPWIMGHALGFFVYHNRTKKFNIPMWLATLIWILALALFAYGALGIYPISQPDYVYNRAYNSYYVAMSSVFSCLGTSWIVFACIFGYGGIMNWFLSLPMWQVLSKLTYSMFITHYLLQYAIHSAFKTVGWHSKLNMFYSFSGLTVLTTIVSIIWTLAFEMPFMVIDTQVFRKMLSKPAPKNQMTLPNLTIQKNDPVGGSTNGIGSTHVSNL